MHFANQSVIFLLLIIPFLIIFYILVFDWKKKAKESFARMQMFERLTPLLSLRKQKVKSLLIVLAVFFLIISICGPQWGEKEKQIISRGVDVFIALDCSQSMMAEDYKPNRLTLAKSLLKKIVDNLQGNRIGVIAFAGASYIECPLTVDMSAVKMYIDDLDYRSIPVQGTSIGEAIRTALEGFPKDEKKSRVLVLLTDGEDLAGNSKKYITLAVKDNLRIYTLGIGTPEGIVIPIKDDKEKKIGEKTDQSGKTVISKLDEKELKYIANVTGGKYLRCSYDERGINEISNDILNMDKKEFGTTFQKQYIDRFQYPLLLVVILLITESLISEKRSENGKHVMNSFIMTGFTGLIVLLLISLGAITSAHASVYGDIRTGNKDYQKGKYKEAEANYDKALKKKPGWDIPIFNWGNSLYKQSKFKESIAKYEEDIKLKGSNLHSKAFYNTGNSYYNMNKLDKAIENYKESLKRNPDDIDAKFNLELALRKQEQKDNKDNKDKNKDNKDKDKNKDNKDKDKNKDNKDKNNKDNKNKDNKDKDKNKDNKDNKNGKNPPQNQQEQPQNDEISKDQAMRILKAFQKEEEKNMKRIRGKYATQQSTGRDW